MPDPVYRSRAIANHLIEHSGAGLDALQVMKLTYIAHGFTLGVYRRSLIEEDVEAWKLGPVVRQIYSILPGGATNIRVPLSEDRADLIPEDREVVDSVLRQYGHFSGLYLSSLTHRPGSPWHKTWSKYGQNSVIPRDLIQSHYAKIIAAARDAEATGRPYHPTVF